MWIVVGYELSQAVNCSAVNYRRTCGPICHKSSSMHSAIHLLTCPITTVCFISMIQAYNIIIKLILMQSRMASIRVNVWMCGRCTCCCYRISVGQHTLNIKSKKLTETNFPTQLMHFHTIPYHRAWTTTTAWQGNVICTRYWCTVLYEKFILPHVNRLMLQALRIEKLLKYSLLHVPVLVTHNMSFQQIFMPSAW